MKEIDALLGALERLCRHVAGLETAVRTLTRGYPEVLLSTRPEELPKWAKDRVSEILDGGRDPVKTIFSAVREMESRVDLAERDINAIRVYLERGGPMGRMPYLPSDSD